MQRGWPIAALACLLTVLAAVYLARGLWNLAMDDPSAGDLRMRWSAQRYVFERQNPYDVQAHVWTLQEGREPPVTERRVEPRSDLGAPGIVGDPPWAFVSGALLFAPGWPAVRWTYAALNLLALGGIGRWAWKQGRPFGWRGAWLLSASALALGAHSTTLGVGQTGTIVVALLAAALMLEERGKSAGSGFLVGVANLKVNVAAPFLLPFLARRRVTALGAAAAYWTVSSCLVWWWIETDPVECLRQMLWGASILEEADAGVLSLLARAGVGGPLAVAVLAGGTCCLGWWILRRLVDRPPLVAFAVACVVARLWTYHRVYDNVLLVFLLVALGVAFLRERSARYACGFLAVGFSLWTPTRFADGAGLATVHLLIWLAGATLLLRAKEASAAPRRRTLAPLRAGP